MGPDCNGDYRYTSHGRVVVVGDLHGHYRGFVDILSCAGLIDERGEWIGGQTTLVQMGDIFGRGSMGKSCADLLMTLELQAAAAGGRVITLLGNHEAMITHHCFRYIPPTELHNFSDPTHPDDQAYETFCSAVGPAGHYGAWLRSLPLAVVVDDCLFVHAGLGWSWGRLGLNRLNQRARECMAIECDYWSLPTDTPISSENGPLWDRRFLMENETDQVATELRATLDDLQAKVMIVGHTPTAFVPGAAGGQIIHRYDGRMIAVDVGINPLYGCCLAWLEIENGIPVEKNITADESAVEVVG